MIKPNIYRILIYPIKLEGITAGAGIVLAGTVKPGENLLYGVVIDPGTTKFKVGQEVFYSEYSAAGLVDARKIQAGDVGALSSRHPIAVVAEDDVMAYYDDIRDLKEALKEDDFNKISELIGKDRPKTKGKD